MNSCQQSCFLFPFSLVPFPTSFVEPYRPLSRPDDKWAERGKLDSDVHMAKQMQVHLTTWPSGKQKKPAPWHGPYVELASRVSNSKEVENGHTKRVNVAWHTVAEESFFFLAPMI